MKRQWILSLALAGAAAAGWVWADGNDAGQGAEATQMHAQASTPSPASGARLGKTKKATKRSKRHKKVGAEARDGARTEGKAVSSAASAKKHRWVCPMDGYVSDHPGKCPRCGMDLVEEQRK